MFKSIIEAEIKSESERVHRYICPLDTPPDEAYHILGMMRTHVFDQIQAIEAKEKEEKEAKEKAEQEKPCDCKEVKEVVEPEVIA